MKWIITIQTGHCWYSGEEPMSLFAAIFKCKSDWDIQDKDIKLIEQVLDTE